MAGILYENVFDGSKKSSSSLSERDNFHMKITKFRSISENNCD